MIVIGEKLNTSIEEVGEAVQNGDVETIKELALSQVRAGAAISTLIAAPSSTESLNF